MIWRLVLGGLLTQRRSLLSTVVFFGALIWHPTVSDWLGDGLVVVMAALAGSKPHSALARRELVVLPAGPHQWQRAGWILLAVFPLLIVTAARACAGAMHALTSDDGWVFHATPTRVMFEVVYFSLVAAWEVRRPERYEPDYRAESGWLRMSALTVAMTAMIAVPFMAVAWLPERLDDVSVVLWICGLAGLGVGLAPLVWPRVSYQQPSTPLPAASTAERTPRSSVSHRTGLWLLIRGVVARALTLTVVMLVLFAALEYRFAGTVFWQPFVQPITDLRFLGAIGMLMLFALRVFPGLGSWLGALKRLPITAGRAALLATVAPAMTPLTFWLALLTIHIAVTAQSPETLRLGVLTVLMGLASLIDAFGTKTGSPRAKAWLGFPLLPLVLYGADANRALVLTLVDHWTLPLTGLLCLALAWGVNLHTITRSPASSRAYRFGWSRQHQGAQ